MRSAVLVLVVAVVAAAGYFGWRSVSQSRAEAAEVDRLVASAEAVLEREVLDSSVAQSVVREIAARERSTGIPHAAEDARLIRVHARLLLAMDRLQAAQKVLDPLVLALEPSVEDLWIGARILKRLHGYRGDAGLAGQAADLAEGHHTATGDVRSLFLSWQCARRADRGDDAERFGEALRSEYGGTPQGKLIAALANESTTVRDLLGLEIEFATIAGPLDAPLPPEEVDFAIAFLKLREAGQSSEQLTEAIGRLENVLRTFPADADTRHMMAFALHRSGERPARDAHLDWLLKNAADDDQRREDWTRMRSEPPGEPR